MPRALTVPHFRIYTLILLFFFTCDITSPSTLKARLATDTSLSPHSTQRTNAKSLGFAQIPPSKAQLSCLMHREGLGPAGHQLWPPASTHGETSEQEGEAQARLGPLWG